MAVFLSHEHFSTMYNMVLFARVSEKVVFAEHQEG